MHLNKNADFAFIILHYFTIILVILHNLITIYNVFAVDGSQITRYNIYS